MRVLSVDVYSVWRLLGLCVFSFSLERVVMYLFVSLRFPWKNLEVVRS